MFGDDSVLNLKKTAGSAETDDIHFNFTGPHTDAVDKLLRDFLIEEIVGDLTALVSDEHGDIITKQITLSAAEKAVTQKVDEVAEELAKAILGRTLTKTNPADNNNGIEDKSTMDACSCKCEECAKENCADCKDPAERCSNCRAIRAKRIERNSKCAALNPAAYDLIQDFRKKLPWNPKTNKPYEITHEDAFWNGLTDTVTEVMADVLLAV